MAIGCQPHDQVRYGRTVAICFKRNEDLRPGKSSMNNRADTTLRRRTSLDNAIEKSSNLTLSQ